MHSIHYNLLIKAKAWSYIYGEGQKQIKVGVEIMSHLSGHHQLSAVRSVDRLENLGMYPWYRAHKHIHNTYRRFRMPLTLCL